MTYVVRMRWAINYRMGYLVHKLGSIQKPRFTVVRKISRKKKLHIAAYKVRSEQSTNHIKKSSTRKNNIQKHSSEQQILQTTVPKYAVIVLCVIKPAGKI